MDIALLTRMLFNRSDSLLVSRKNLVRVLSDLFNLVADVASEVTITGIDVKDAGATDYSGALPGDGTKRFVPLYAIFTCLTDNALNGDVQVKMGLSLGGTEILPATPLTGLDDSGKSYLVVMAGLFASILDNATLHVQVSTPDSGTSGTMKCFIVGRSI